MRRTGDYPSCHCGQDGHPFHSVNCPKHGTDAQAEQAALHLYYGFNGYATSWSHLPVADRAYWVAAAKECLDGAEQARNAP